MVTDRIITTRSLRQLSLSQYYSDIGTIEDAAYINTRRTQVDSIQNYQQRLNCGYDVSPAASNGNCNSREGLERTRRVRFVAVISCPRYLRQSVFKNQFLLDGCSDYTISGERYTSWVSLNEYTQVNTRVGFQSQFMLVLH